MIIAGLSRLGSLLGGVQRGVLVWKRGLFGIVGMERTACARLLMLNHRENRRQNDQRREGGADEAADNRAAERGGLAAAFAKSGRTLSLRNREITVTSPFASNRSASSSLGLSFPQQQMHDLSRRSVRRRPGRGPHCSTPG
jgi:hypothetical protein